MGEPVILVVDDDRETPEALSKALHRRFRADFRVVAERSAPGVLRALDDLRDAGEAVAIVVARPEWTLDATRRCDDPKVGNGLRR